MDFLDPRSKKRRTIRLMIGYTLVGIMILTTSTILVFQAYGFDVDRKTGEVIQNGLVFVDSAPDDAAILLNGQQLRNRTNARLAIPDGTYELKIVKDGYRDWSRSFDLSGGEVARFTYPMLIQSNLAPEEIVSVGTGAPQVTTQSPDRRWLLISKPASHSEFFEFDLNNLDNQTDIPRQRSLSFAAEIFSDSSTSRTLEVVEWSTDNKHVLIKHTFSGGAFEFIMLNRDNPETSFNINRLIERNPDDIRLRDKKFDQWYIYSELGGVLETANDRKVLQPVLQNVTDFKPHDSDTLLYAQSTEDGTKQRVFIRNKDDTYLLRELAAGDVQLDVARYDGKWFMVIASDGDKKTYIYKDPIPALEKTPNRRPAPIMILNTKTGIFNWMGFSQNTRFVVAQSGQHFEVYDAEYDDVYRYDVSDEFDIGSEVAWMDGHRLIARSSGKAVIFDFDGSNRQTLIDTMDDRSLFFNRDYTDIFTVNSSKEQSDKFSLILTSLRFEQDK